MAADDQGLAPGRPITLQTGHVVTVRALEQHELDAAREAAGPFPMWGQKVDERFDRARDDLVKQMKAEVADMPAIVRPGDEEIAVRAYESARALMLDHDPQGWAAREAYNAWTVNVAARTAAAGLATVEGWKMPDAAAGVERLIQALPGSQPLQFIAEVGALVREVTTATEGKGQAPRSPSTSAPAELVPPGASGVTAAPTT